MPLDYRAIMSGRRTGPLAAIMRGMLRVASVAYHGAVAWRNRRFDSDASRTHRCGVPVISVGNLTTGGTGKTPIVCCLAKWFRSRGIRVAIVSRGYGRGDADENDEALELHARLGDVPHVQDTDRVEAARIAIDELAAQVVLMDDGFQHRRLHRDLDIVVIDATCPFGFGFLLPRGLLREPISSLRRADFVIITRSDSADPSQRIELEHSVRSAGGSIPMLHSRHQPTSILEYPTSILPVEDLSGQSVAVVSAIGNPDAFEATVRSCGATIVDARRLPDHDPYGPDTVRGIDAWVQSLGDRAERVICTHKDLVKLRTDRIGRKPLGALLIDLQLEGDTGDLDDKLQSIADAVDD